MPEESAAQIVLPIGRQSVLDVALYHKCDFAGPKRVTLTAPAH